MKVDFKVNGNKLVLSKKLLKNENYKINNKSKIFSLVIHKKPVKVVGVSSMCQDGNHILMLDYDQICKWIVEEDLKRILVKYDLSPFYMFKTAEDRENGELVGNYHCICLTKMSPNKVLEIQQDTHCDNSYRTMPLRNIYRSWVLRTSNKGKKDRPRFLKSISDGNLSNNISTAHLKLLRRLYNVTTYIYPNQDNIKTVYKNIYETGNI